MKKVMYNNSELSGSFGQENTPVGTILMYGGTTLPFGYMWCNGSAVSRTVYADLFNAIGTAFGSGDGSTTFNLPDWRERVPMGASDDYPLGSTGGEKEHTLTALELPSHEHGIYIGNTRVHYYGNFNVASGSSGGYWAGSQGTQPTVAKGGVGDQPHNNLQPYQTCNYIIKFCKAITPAQEQFIDDSSVSAEKTWSSEKIQSSTSIIVHSVVLKTTLSGTTTVSTYNGRNLSDYKLLLFSIGTNDSICGTTIVPINTFKSYSAHVSANHNTGLSQISGVQFIYVDDTHIRCELAGSEVLNTVYVEAIK